MADDNPLRTSPLEQWFTLDDLLASVLGDITSADANFQLQQAEAWHRFADSLSHLEGFSHLSAADFSAGIGRLENLGLDACDISLQLDIRRRSWWRRAWGRISGIFGAAPTAAPELYRLADERRRRRGRIELRISVVRDPDATWRTRHQSKPV